MNCLITRPRRNRYVQEAPKIIKVGVCFVRPATRPRRGMAGDARGGDTRPRAQSAEGYELRGTIHGAGVHLALPRHRPAGFRASRDRLCPRAMAAGIEIAKALCRE